VHFRTPPVPPQALCLSSNAANFWQCVGILRPTNAQASIVPGGPGMVSGEGPPLSLKSEGAHFAIRSTCGSNHVRTGEEHPCWCQWMWSWIMIVTAPTVTATAAIPIRMVSCQSGQDHAWESSFSMASSLPTVCSARCAASSLDAANGTGQSNALRNFLQLSNREKFKKNLTSFLELSLKMVASNIRQALQRVS
jgi:hypothetical protein